MTFRSNPCPHYPTRSGRDRHPPTFNGTMRWLEALGYEASPGPHHVVVERKLRPLGVLMLRVGRNGEHRRMFD